jgi:hypothetical protein
MDINLRDFTLPPIYVSYKRGPIQSYRGREESGYDPSGGKCIPKATPVKQNRGRWTVVTATPNRLFHSFATGSSHPGW